MLTKYLQITLITAWALAFYWLLTFGRPLLARLLHPNLWWLVVTGAVILLLFLAVSICRPAPRRRYLWRLQLPPLLILALPLLYLFFSQDARLGADTFSKRSLRSDLGFSQNTERNWSFRDDGGEDISLARLVFDRQRYLGQEVTVVCQSFVDEGLPEGIAMCYRYLISCCAADAQPLFVFIQQPTAEPIANDRWIRVVGTLSLVGNEQVELPLITPGEVSYVEEPPFPYIY
ncbi:MAG TPA: hypothetical protein VK857_00735 [Desulforhopalus sp.]|nr:hypothetical protein [Desulforhopalus sp.]